MGKNDGKNIKKSGLSNGYKTDVYSKLNKLLFNRNKEFYINVKDNYIKAAFCSFLKDLGLKEMESKGDYILVSTTNNLYKFYEKRPDVRIYDIPSDWELITLKISSIVDVPKPQEIETKPKVETNPKVDKVPIKSKSNRVYLIDCDNNRYYEGYSTILFNGVIIDIKVSSYNNSIMVESTDSNVSKELEKFLSNIKRKDLVNKIVDSNDIDLKIYDSSIDGLLKSKVQLEIESMKDEIEENGFCILENGDIFIKDKEKVKKYKNRVK